MKNKCKTIWKQIWCFILIFTILLVSDMPVSRITGLAAEKALSVGQAKALALSNSTECMLTQSKISLKEVGYKQAVKSLQLKRKNKTTFRWSPTLNFKFPEALDMSEESEYIFKPMQLQSEITELRHKLTDLKFAVYEEVSNLFVSVYSYQEIIKFQEDQLESLEKTLAKNKARALLGLADAKDITSIENSMDSLKNSLSQNKRNYESEKKELSDLINLDVTTQYRFLRPYVETEIPRSQLDNLVEYTLEYDQSFYEAKMTTQLSLLQLDTNYELMEGQYGSKMSYISSYVLQVKRGEKIDGNAFKLSYDKFLVEIDKPWTGTKKILFVKVPKEWFKGEIDGVRYIEDEPYTLYENALEYQDALAEQNQLEKEIRQQVEEAFESQISARNSYEAMLQQIEKEKKNLESLSVLNALGSCTFEEYTDAQEQYEDLLMESLEALSLYSTQLYSYDRLTCGAISLYLSEKEISVNSSSGAESYIVKEDEEYEGAYYYIRRLVEDNIFELGIYIPDELETDITHFELWCDGIQIGTRTEKDKTIRHLVLSQSEINKAVVRLYEEDTYVSECEIDPQSYQGRLEIPGGYLVVKEQDKIQVGTFVVSKDAATSLVRLEMEFNSSESICYYTLKNADGKYLLSQKPIPAETAFEYLALLSDNLGELTVQCYGSDKQLKYEAYLELNEYKIYVKE